VAEHPPFLFEKSLCDLLPFRFVSKDIADCWPRASAVEAGSALLIGVSHFTVGPVHRQIGWRE